MDKTSDASQSVLQTVSPDLLRLLVCPVDKGALRADSDRLVCTICGRRYPVEDGIPNVLPEHAE